jgi:Family of unknown function (DUF6088)
MMKRHSTVKGLPTSAVAKIKHEICREEGRYWRQSDFPSLPPAAVSQALSRLAKAGELERVSKGLYYRPRETRFGRSRPSQREIQQKVDINPAVKPVGISATNLLGFTTQNSIQGEVATSANSAPRKILGSHVRIHTRRPSTWDKLSVTDAALLDFLRSRGKLSELSLSETKQRLLRYFKDGDRFERIAEIAEAEPPRVRAMLGAIGQEIGKSTKKLEPLRKSLNPVSRFDFGILQNLLYAKDWQAK